VLADAGVENVNAHVDDLITTGVLRRVLAFTEVKFSNSMIEAWWRSLKHQWLFLHSLDSVTTVRRLVEFYVHEHNRVLPQIFRSRDVKARCEVDLAVTRYARESWWACTRAATFADESGRPGPSTKCGRPRL
jgi:hypothetical protein